METRTKKQIELELKRFTAKNFTEPKACTNLDQVRFYIQELCLKIQELQKSGYYVPNWAYQLLSQYNARQHAMIHIDFRKSYSD
jgi:hypothetical protein